MNDKDLKTMKSLSDYLLGVRKEYTVKIRFACDLTDKDVDRIEEHLKRYDLIKISAPKKTIFQTNALGFENPVNCEVMIFEVTLGLPVAFNELRYELARCVKQSDARVAVTGDFDVAAKTNPEPTKVEEEDTYVGKRTVVPAHEIDYDHKEIAGQEYNDDMIKTLSDARKEAKKQILGNK